MKNEYENKMGDEERERLNKNFCSKEGIKFNRVDSKNYAVAFRDHISLNMLQPETYIPLKEFDSVKKALNNM